MKKIFFTGGGTGGHIYPGFAVADEINRIEPEIEIHFVGAKRPLDMEILSKCPYKKHYIFIHAVNTKNKIKKLLGLMLLPIAFLQAFILLKKERPEKVVGFGGYASFPVLYVAYLMGIPTAIWEANAYPGLVSRFMANRVEQIFLNFKDDRNLYPLGRVKVIGVPTRFHNVDSSAKEEKFRVFIFGGSSGARSINEKVYELLKEVDIDPNHKLRDIKFIHQIGSLDYERFKKLYHGFSLDLEVREFIHNMPEELSKADLLICRAGASTVAEVSLSRKVAIFIPLPWAADNHQYENAKRLADRRAAIILEQKDLNSKSLALLIDSFRKDPGLREKMEKNLEIFASPDAAKKMAKHLLEK